MIFDSLLSYVLKQNYNQIYHFTFQGTSNGQTAVTAYAPISTTKASPEYLKMTSKINSVIENKAKNIPSEPEYITAEFVRQKKMANAASHSSHQGNLTNTNNGKIIYCISFYDSYFKSHLHVKSSFHFQIDNFSHSKQKNR